MKITKQEIDALNAVLTIDVSREDYASKVEKTLKNYQKTANIPGFRKGNVPMGMIKKQYERAVQADEINKLLDAEINKFLTEEKLDILGSPLPKQSDVDWDAPLISFSFDLGLAPKFDINLKGEKGICYFDIQVENSLVDNQVERIRKQFGKLISQAEVQNDTELVGFFFNEEKNINKRTSFSVELLSESALSSFLGKKVADQVTISTEGLFKDTHDLMHHLGVSHEQAHHLKVSVTFTIDEVNKREPAELNQELFDKLFGAEQVTSEEEMRAKILENVQLQYNQQADQQFLNDVTDHLLDNTKFELPSDFLKKWLRTAGERVLTEQEATEEYEKSEKGLRYQLIEGKIARENNLQVTFPEIKDFIANNIRMQMLQFGMEPDEKQIDDISKRIFQNREEIDRVSQQIMGQKLLHFYKENVTLNKKQVTYDEFIKEVYPAE